MSDFQIKCHGKVFRVERFKVIKPFEDGVMREEYKKLPIDTCPNCASLVIERMRIRKKENGTIKKETVRLLNGEALEYLQEVAEKSEIKRIYDYTVQKGSASAANFFYGFNNTKRNLNDKSYGKVVLTFTTGSGNFTQELALVN